MLRSSTNKQRLAIVDCENCDIKVVRGLLDIEGIDIVLILGKFQSCDKIKIYIENNKAYEVINKTKGRKLRCSSVTVYKCDYNGKNAADFLLTYELCKYIPKYKNKPIFIVSADKAFTHIALYANSDGFDVNTLNFTQVSSGSQIYLRKALEVLSKTKSGSSLSSLAIKLSSRYSDIDEAECALLQLSKLGIIKIRKVKVNQVYFRKSLIEQFL